MSPERTDRALVGTYSALLVIVTLLLIFPIATGPGPSSGRGAGSDTHAGMWYMTITTVLPQLGSNLTSVSAPIAATATATATDTAAAMNAKSGQSERGFDGQLGVMRGTTATSAEPTTSSSSGVGTGERLAQGVVWYLGTWGACLVSDPHCRQTRTCLSVFGPKKTSSSTSNTTATATAGTSPASAATATATATDLIPSHPPPSSPAPSSLSLSGVPHWPAIHSCTLWHISASVLFFLLGTAGLIVLCSPDSVCGTRRQRTTWVALGCMGLAWIAGCGVTLSVDVGVWASIRARARGVGDQIKVGGVFWLSSAAACLGVIWFGVGVWIWRRRVWVTLAANEDAAVVRQRERRERRANRARENEKGREQEVKEKERERARGPVGAATRGLSRFLNPWERGR